VPAWKCGCARAGQLTATRAPRAPRATRLIPTALGSANREVAANREGASVLGLVAPDELSVL
jgi:hypothetical protein